MPFVLRLAGDVRRFWYGRVVDSRGQEIGSSFAPKASGKGPDLCQRYDCTPYVPHGAVRHLHHREHLPPPPS